MITLLFVRTVYELKKNKMLRIMEKKWKEAKEEDVDNNIKFLAIRFKIRFQYIIESLTLLNEADVYA